jgi:hypothetical protein
MADARLGAAEEVINQITNRLYDNLLGQEKEIIEFVKNASIVTKERLVKDNILKKTNKFIEALNNEFKDVKFICKWSFGTSMLNHEMHRYDSDLYNQEYLEEEDDFYSDPDIDYFYETALTDLTIKIEYYWERICSLGCKHRTKRFMIMNIPKLIDFIEYIHIGMPARTFVKEFIPDFFYDPTQPPKKRGRPKSSRS